MDSDSDDTHSKKPRTARVSAAPRPAAAAPPKAGPSTSSHPRFDASEDGELPAVALAGGAAPVRAEDELCGGEPEARERVEAEEVDGGGEVVGEDEDGEGEEEEDEDAQSGSPRGSKRARINGDGDSVPGRGDSQPPLPRVKTQPRDVDQYVVFN